MTFFGGGPQAYKHPGRASRVIEASTDVARNHFRIHEEIRRSAMELKVGLHASGANRMRSGEFARRVRGARSLVEGDRCEEALEELQDLKAFLEGLIPARGRRASSHGSASLRKGAGRRVGLGRGTAVGMLVLVLLMVWATALPAARAQVAAPGYAATNFATGFAVTSFVNCCVLGPIGLAFDASGNLFVGNIGTGFLYKFGSAGGVASPSTQVNAAPIPGFPAGLAFTKDGRLYLARRITAATGDVVELDRSTGTVIRTIASISSPTGLATDPLSGDLFVSQACGCGAISRISNFASGPGTITVYASVDADGLAFGPDGTLYAAAGGLGGVVKIAGTDSATPGATTFIASVPFVDGLAVSANPSTLFLYGNRNDGIITKVDLSTTPPTLTDIVSGGSRGDFATVGSDGCLYATQTDSVIKVTNADGSCLPPPLGPLFTTNPSTLTVSIDIKPGSFPNAINLGSKGLTPVAILSTATFDATTVDPATVKLAGAFVALKANGQPMASIQDVNGDGVPDLVLQVPTSSLQLTAASTMATLTGQTFGGQNIQGTDSVVIVPPS